MGGEVQTYTRKIYLFKYSLNEECVVLTYADKYLSCRWRLITVTYLQTNHKHGPGYTQYRHLIDLYTILSSVKYKLTRTSKFKKSRLMGVKKRPKRTSIFHAGTV